MNKIIKLILVLALMFASYSGGYASGEYYTETPSEARTLATVRQDPELLYQATIIGIDVTGLNLELREQVEADNTSDAVGAFASPNTIIIKEGLDDWQVRTTLAHEYSHYAWYSNPQIRDTDNYLKYLADDAWVQAKLSAYHDCDLDCQADEANAYICSELPAYRLSKTYDDFCNQFITNRTVLFQ